MTPQKLLIDYLGAVAFAASLAVKQPAGGKAGTGPAAAAVEWSDCRRKRSKKQRGKLARNPGRR